MKNKKGCRKSKFFSLQPFLLKKNYKILWLLMKLNSHTPSLAWLGVWEYFARCGKIPPALCATPCNLQ